MTWIPYNPSLRDFKPISSVLPVWVYESPDKIKELESFYPRGIPPIHLFFQFLYSIIINPILIRVYPRKWGWPDLSHSNSNLSNSHSLSRSIHDILFLQTNTLAIFKMSFSFHYFLDIRTKAQALPKC